MIVSEIDAAGESAICQWIDKGRQRRKRRLKDGRFAPALDRWAANAVLGVLAFFLFRRLLKN